MYYTYIYIILIYIVYGEFMSSTAGAIFLKLPGPQATMIPGDDDTRAWSFVVSLAIGWESQAIFSTATAEILSDAEC
jgi:hypothetical protein